MELERIYGITNGGNRGNQYNKKEAHWNNSNLPTQKDLADQIGIDQSQLINYKKLTTLIPELQDLIETDQIKANQFGSVVSPTLDEPIRTDESVAKDLDMGRLLGRI